MPIQRPRATELARLLNASERPIYVLDCECTFVFCNQSLTDAIGAAAIDLPGRRAAYHGFLPSTTANGAADSLRGVEAAAAGLCPPPQVMAGQPQIATVSWIAADGRLHRRRAQFIPLCEDAAGGQVLAVVVVVATDDLSESASASDAIQLAQALQEPPLSETARLHERVREFLWETAALRGVERFIGASDAICLARRRLELAAASRAGVLIAGPPGSGRRRAAETIHYAAKTACGGVARTSAGEAASDADQPGSLIPLDCAALDADLIRSTAAALAAGSLGENSRGSTLLLLDAELLPAEAQAELAAMFLRKTFHPRLIATSRRPLSRLVRKGRFRQDLAAVLSTIVIELPPLAERREDIRLLAQMFVERENAAGGKQIGGLSPEALDCLDAYDWPGNIDELALMISESHANAVTALITPRDLPKRLHQAAQAAAHPRRAPETIVLDEFLAEIERELIGRAMSQAKGNKAKAARLLGLTRPRLYRRLLQLGMAQPEATEEVIFEEAEEDTQEGERT